MKIYKWKDVIWQLVTCYQSSLYTNTNAYYLDVMADIDP